MPGAYCCVFAGIACCEVAGADAAGADGVAAAVAAGTLLNASSISAAVRPLRSRKERFVATGELVTCEPRRRPCQH